MEVQTRIAKYIEDNCLKKSKVAQKAGLKTWRFSLILNNKSQMRADEFESICKALEVSPDKFMCVQQE